MIRPATEKDVPEILAIYAPYVEESTANPVKPKGNQR